ncbi:MAG: hypothetical protein ABIU29_11235 [Chthoniobacterales bacterium]
MRSNKESVVEETRRAPAWKAYFERFDDPYLRLKPDEYAAAAERSGFRVLRLQTADQAWDFVSRAAFAGFCAVGSGAWTDRLPAAERPKFLNDVLRRYQSVRGGTGRGRKHLQILSNGYWPGRCLTAPISSACDCKTF